ncbi:protein PRRC2C [Salix suchowensis]|nr:protein PRRC2C [Salix suchowensis]
MLDSNKDGPHTGQSLRSQTPPVSGTDRPFTYSASVLQFETPPSQALLNPESMDVHPSPLAQQPAGALQFGTPPSHALSNLGSMNVKPPPLAQQPAGALQFGTPPSHALSNPGAMHVQPSQLAQQPAGALQFGTPPSHALSNPGSMHVQPPQLAQQPAGALQLGTPPSHALSNPGSMHVQPPQLAQQPAGALQFGTLPSHTPLNPRSMHVQPPLLAQQPGTSQSSNVSNADAEKEARIRESKRKSWVKKETGRKENEKRLAEVTKENGVLLEAIARLEKEGGEAKVKQKSVEQELSYCKEEVSRLNNKLRGQTMQVDALSEKLVASPEATDVAEENKQLKRKIELLTTATNNPDIIKTVELQEENEKLKRELKKLRILNDALCVKLSKDEQ